MFIGLDVCHPGRQPAHERRLGIPPQEPSVVGMCYSNGQNVLDFGGVYWYQEPRREKIVENLKGYMVDALREFALPENRGEFPSHLFVFRDGVSEGQYRMVVEEEVAQIRAACSEAVGNRQYQPHVTVIVLQKRGNQRVMLPAALLKANRSSRAPDQNVPSGTCIDKEMMHPSYTEFMLVSHKTIQGTACPLRCTVLVDDEPRVPLEELQGLTHTLSFAHEIVAGPISMPAPAYGADEVASRGRDNFREYMRLSLERGSSDSGKGKMTPRPDFAALSEELRERIQTKFWA